MPVYKVQRMANVWYEEEIEAKSVEEAQEMCDSPDIERGFDWTDEYWIEEIIGDDEEDED